MRKNELLIFIFLIKAMFSFAQKKIISENQQLLWTRYHQTLRFSEKITWANEMDNRVFLSNFHQNQFIAHTHVHYSFTNLLETSVGGSYSHINFANPATENGFVSPELRLFQEIYLRQSLSDEWKIQHRFRSEQRFFRKNNGVELFDGYTYNGRARYQLAVAYVLAPKIELKFNDELMVNFGKNIVYNTFDQNRTYVGVAYKIRPELTAELGYLKIISQRPTGNEYVDRDNLRFTLFHTIHLSRKKT